jgi:hypothetical protein
MCEDHIYWLILGDRWLNDANVAKGHAASLEYFPI